MPQRADGQRINQLIDELAQREGKRITFAEVCRRTDELGDGFVAIEERTLNRARNNKRVDEAYLKSLATVLGAELSDLVKSDEDDEQARAGRGGVWIKKKMIAKAKPNAPAVNAEEGATVQISIGVAHKE